MSKFVSKNKLVKSYRLKRFMLGAVSLAFGIALSACSKTENDQTMGQRIDFVMNKTRQAVTEANVKTDHAGVDLKAKAEETFSSAGKALKNATENAEASARMATGKAIENMDDLAITTAVSAELIKDPEIRVFMVNVHTADGAVTLNGSVPTQTVRDRASAISRTFNGVQSVNNKLVVKNE